MSTAEASPVLRASEEVTVEGDDFSYKNLDALLERDERNGIFKDAQISRLDDGRVEIVVPGKPDPKTEYPYDEVYHVGRKTDGGIFLEGYKSVDSVRNDVLQNAETKTQATYAPDGNMKYVWVQDTVMNGQGDVISRSTDTMDFEEGTELPRAVTSDEYTMRPDSGPGLLNGMTSNTVTREDYVAGKLSRSETLTTETRNNGGTVREEVFKNATASGGMDETRTRTDRQLVEIEEGKPKQEQVKQEMSFQNRDTPDGPVVYRREENFDGTVKTRDAVTTFDQQTGLYNSKEITVSPNGSWSYATSTSKDGKYEDQQGEKLNYNAEGKLVSTQTAGQDKYVGWDDPVYMQGFEPRTARNLNLTPDQ